MNIADFKTLVTDFMNRSGVTFDMDTTGSVDKVLSAANNAKAYAQRLVRFELAKKSVQVTVTQSAGGDLSDAALVSDGTPVRVRAIRRCYLPLGEGDTYVPVEYVSKETGIRTLDYQGRSQGWTNPVNYTDNGIIQVTRFGDIVTIMPWPDTNVASYVLRMDAWIWMPEYGSVITGTNDSVWAQSLQDTTADFITAGVAVGDVVINTTTGAATKVTGIVDKTWLTLTLDIFTEAGHGYQIGTGAQTDFFLTECRDWMLFKTISELNFYLKEDQRVVLSNSAMNEAWRAVLAWNADVAQTETDLDLE